MTTFPSPALQGMISPIALGAVTDGQKIFLNLSMAVGGSTLTVSMPSVWEALTNVTMGAVRINGTNLYLCTTAGETAASGGPTVGSQPGAQIVDGTAQWLLLGPAPTTANVFAASDVGKSIFVVRQDVVVGWCPWYTNGGSGYTAVAKITACNSPTSVTLNVVGTAAPGDLGTAFPNQTWPYSATPSVIMWGTDNSAAFQAALNAGSSVFIPDGNYCFAEQLVLNSGNTLFGNGTAANLMPLGVTGFSDSGGSNGVQFIINKALLNHWNTYENNTPPSLPVPIPVLRASIGDRDLTIRDLQIDMSGSGLAIGGTTMRWFLVTHGLVTNIKIISTPNSGYEAPNFIGCADISVVFNDYDNVGNGYDPWSACTDMLFAYNRLVVPYCNTPNVTYGGSACAIQINCVGTTLQDDQICSNFSVLFNDIFINGSAGSYATPQGIWVVPDGGGSGYIDFKIQGNKIYCTGANNRPMLLDGGSLNLDVSDNLIDGYDGSGGPAINVVNENSASAGEPTSIVATLGSSTMTVNWPNHNFTGYWLSELPAFFFDEFGTTVGGVSVNGYFPILSVVNANSFTINALAEATSNQTVAWAGAFAAISCYSIGAQVARNKLKDCAAPGGPLINVSGIAASINENQVILTDAAVNGNYLGIVFWSGINNQRTATIQGNTGPTGTGSIGVAGGNNRVYWNVYEPAPVVIDPDDNTVSSLTPALNFNPTGAVPSSGVFLPALSFGGASTGIVYNEQAGNYTKVGNLCFFSLNCSVSNKGSAKGTALISGLPFSASAAGTPLGYSVDIYAANMVGLTASPASSTTPIVYTDTVGTLTYMLVVPGTGGATGNYALAYSGGTGSGASGSFAVVGTDGVASLTIANAGSGGTNGTYTIPLTGAATTAAVATILVVGGKITEASASPGAGYSGTPTLSLASIPGLVSGSVTAALGVGGIVAVYPGAGGSYTVAPTISTAAASGLVGASITAAANTTGSALSLGVMGTVAGTQVILSTGPSIGVNPLTDANFGNGTFLRMAGWYFTA